MVSIGAEQSLRTPRVESLKNSTTNCGATLIQATHTEKDLYWQKNDKKSTKRINALIKDIQRNKYEGIGKPETLKHNLSGYWSRRITNEHRIVYKIEDDSVLIAQLRYHY